MIRIFVIALLTVNLLLVGLHVASEPPDPHRPVAQLQPQIAPNVPPLQLVDELEMLPVNDLLQCFSLGPFETTQSLQLARAQVEPKARTVNERESEALVELGYWVTLPAEASFADAGAAMRELTAAGITDVAVVGDAEGLFRVSLGYFLDERNARKRRNQARDLGFTADTQLQRVTQPRYWLDYAVAAGTEFTTAFAGPETPAGNLQRPIPCADNFGP